MREPIWLEWAEAAIQNTLMTKNLIAVALGLSWIGLVEAGETNFQDDFEGKLQPGWSWIRENPAGWRVTKDGLEIRVEPGNMWGGANDARNLLTRPAPDPSRGPVEITVRVENRPTEQYEQVDLVWYYDDSHMVKIGQEKVDGQLSIVMGREEKDRTRTLAIIPLDSHEVQLRLRAEGTEIEGAFRTPAMEDWQTAGRCDLPGRESARITIQCYQGPRDAAHWAKIREFRLRQSGNLKTR